MAEESIRLNPSHRVPARVLACLTRDTVTVILHPGVGLADGGIKTELRIEAVPRNLRMPNSEFDIVFDSQKWDYGRVVRKGEPELEPARPAA